MHPTIFALKRAYQATRKSLEEELAPYDLTAAQLDVLGSLEGSQHLEQRELQEALGVSAPTLARILDTMEEKELVVRKTSPDDSRVKVISISEQGAELRKTIKEAVEEAFTEQFFDGLTHTDADRLTRLLNQIADNMGDTSQDIYR